MSWHAAGSCGHLGPQAPGKLAGDGGHDHVLGGLAGGQAAEPAAQAQLRCPCPRDYLWVKPLLAAGDLGAHPWPVLVGPGRLDQLGAQVGVAGLGQMPAPGLGAAGVLAGTSPQKPMNWLARANRRQSQTSAASVSAPSRVTPR
jgi:hypothetical protein